MNNPKTIPPREAIRREQSFPLISILQFSTFCIALVLCIDFKELSRAMQNVQGVEFVDILIPILLVCLLGFLIGAAVGLGHIRMWRSFLYCGFAGAVVANLILATFVAPAKPGQAFAACLLPLISTLIFRFRTR